MTASEGQHGGSKLHGIRGQIDTAPAASTNRNNCRREHAHARACRL